MARWASTRSSKLSPRDSAWRIETEAGESRTNGASRASAGTRRSILISSPASWLSQGRLNVRRARGRGTSFGAGPCGNLGGALRGDSAGSGGAGDNSKTFITDGSLGPPDEPTMQKNKKRAHHQLAARP